MEAERIKSPDGIRRLMAELWSAHSAGLRPRRCRICMVDLPDPTPEEKRIMAGNRAARQRADFIDNPDNTLLQAAATLGGW